MNKVLSLSLRKLSSSGPDWLEYNHFMRLSKKEKCYDEGHWRNE